MRLIRLPSLSRYGIPDFVYENIYSCFATADFSCRRDSEHDGYGESSRYVFGLTGKQLIQTEGNRLARVDLVVSLYFDR